MAKKAPAKQTQFTVISIVYIFLGIGSVLGAFEAIKGLFSGVVPSVAVFLSLAAGILTFLAGVFGLFRLQKGARVWMGVLVFLVSLAGLVFAILHRDFSAIGTSLMQAAVAWLYIVYN